MAIFFTILVICNFGSGTEYYTDGPAVTYDGHFYSEGVLYSIEELTIGFSLDGDFVSSNFTIKFHDAVFGIRNRNESDLHNSIISLFLFDGTTATKITSGYVSKIGCSAKYAILKCSTENTSFYKYFLYTINREEFPACPEDSVGQTINYMFAETHDNASGEPKIGKAYKVILPGSKDYIFARMPTHGDAPNTNLGDIDRVFDNGTEINFNIITDTITIEGIEYKRGFIDYAPGPPATNNPLLFTSHNSMQEFEEIPEKMVKIYEDIDYNNSNIADLKAFFIKRAYIRYQTPTKDILYIGALYSQNITGIRLLLDFCQSTLTNYIIKDNELLFRWIDYAEIEGSEAETFDETVLDVNGYETDTDWISNEITVNYNYDGEGGFLRVASFAFIDSVDSRDQYGTKSDIINAPFLGYFTATFRDFHARVTAKHYQILHSRPITRVTASGALVNTGMLYPGDFIKLKHLDLKTPGEYRHYLIEEAACNLSEGNSRIDLQLIDVEHLKNIDYNCYFLLHSWIDGSTEFWSDAPGLDTHISSVNEIAHAAVAGSLGGAMISGNGIDKWLILSTINNYIDYFDILQFSDYTIFFEFKMNTYSTNQWYMNCFEDSNNEWYIRQRGSDSKIQFRLYEGGVLRLTLISTTAITDTDIHQVAVIKVGDEYGLYIDGDLEAYNTGSYSYSIDGQAYFLIDPISDTYLDGYMGEIYLGSSNIFDAAPDVGLTDTIVVKTKPFNWYGLNE